MALSDLFGPALQIGATLLSAGSQSARGTAYQAVGRRRAAARAFEAGQLEQEAVLSRGVGLREAQDIALKARLVNSTALARAAASGAGASDPTVVAILAQTAGEGAYRQSLAMYEAEAQARLDLTRAAATRYEGETAISDADAAKRISDLGVASTVLSGGVKALSMYDKYWAGKDID